MGCTGVSCNTKKTETKSKSNVVGANSGNCVIKNTATENQMSKNTQSIFEKGASSNNGKGLSVENMTNSLKNSGLEASNGVSEKNGKAYVDITENGKTYRLWDCNKDGNLSEADFNKQLSSTSSSLKDSCSSGNCNNDTSSDCSTGNCNKDKDTSSDCSTGNCNNDTSSDCSTGNCNGTGSSGNCNKTGADKEGSTGDDLTNKVVGLLQGSAANKNASEEDLQAKAQTEIANAKSALGSDATDDKIYGYIAGKLGGKAGTSTGNNNTSTGNNSNSGTNSNSGNSELLKFCTNLDPVYAA